MLTIYSKANCPNCVKCKILFNTIGVMYDEINIGVEPAARDKLIKDGHKAVPQVYKDDEHLFSYDAIKDMNKDELKALLHYWSVKE